MKKSLVTIAVASALAAPMMAHAESKGPTVYGQLNVSYGKLDEKKSGATTVDTWEFRSHDSRLGVKGERDFGNGLIGTYKIELGVNPDGDGEEDPTVLDETTAGVDLNGDGDALDIIEIEHDGTAGISRRNMYVGLKGGFGEFRFGRHDTPLKMAQGKFDQFGDTDGDIKNAGDEDGENRLDNILAYLGQFGGVGVAVAVAPGEQTGPNTDDGPADTISASISYTGGPFYIAVAQDSYANAGNAAEDSLTRVVATWKFSSMQVGLLYQTGVEAPDSATAKEDWLGASFYAKIGTNGKIKAQYITVEDSQATPLEGTLMAVGYDHKFDKKTTGYVHYVDLQEEQGGTKTLESNSLVAGLKLKF